MAFIHLFDIVAELALQEVGGVLAVNGDHAQMAQVGEHQTGDGDLQFAFRVAVMNYDIIHEFGTGVIAKKVSPEVFHHMAFWNECVCFS